MATAPKKRKLRGVGENILGVVSLLETRYGAVLTHDSGHTIGPTWIFTVEGPQGIQVGVRMNKRSLSLYLSDRTADGRPLEPLLEGLGKVKESYPNTVDRNPAASVSGYHAHYLRPGDGNRLLLVETEPQFVLRIFDLYIAPPQSDQDLPPPATVQPARFSLSTL